MSFMATPPEPKKIKRVRVIRVPLVVQVKTLHLRTRSHGICLWRHGWRLKWMVSPRRPATIGDCEVCHQPVYENQPWGTPKHSQGDVWHLACIEPHATLKCPPGCSGNFPDCPLA